MRQRTLACRAAVPAFCAVALAWGPVALAATGGGFDCVIDPSLTLKLGSPVASIIESVEVDRGDRVRSGQVVARLESAVEEATVKLNEARAASTAEIEARQVRAELAQKELARASSLQEHSVVSAQRVDELRSAFRVAQHDLALAELNRRIAELELRRSQATVEQRVIRSPIDGIVTQRSLGPGEYVHQDAHIVSIASIDPLFVETFPPIRVYGSVHEGDVAVVRPDEPVGGERRAVVIAIDQVFDAASGTFGVRLTLPNPDGSIPAGLRCRVSFATSTAAGAAPR